MGRLYQAAPSLFVQLTPLSSSPSGGRKGVAVAILGASETGGPSASPSKCTCASLLRYGYLMMRMTIGVVFAAAFTICGAAQDVIAQSETPALAFPKPD